LIRVHMQTPVWASEPVPSSPLRTVDLFPAMLSWLGVPVPDDIDGETVWNPARSLPERTSRRTVEVGALAARAIHL
jgi:arylsulfatase A-like enzyme